MTAPFLQILCVTQTDPEPSDLILIGSGPSIFCFNATKLDFVSSWSHTKFDRDNTSGHTLSDDANEECDIYAEPQAKRRKLSRGDEDDEVSDAPSAEIIVDNNGQRPRKKKKKPEPVSCISKLCASNDGRHIIAVTSDDKTVRVLELTHGCLTQISQR